MWTIIKLDRKKISFLIKDFQEKLGKDFIIYSPKLLIEKHRKNKIVNSEVSLLGNYIFFYHKKLNNPLMLNSLRFSRGLKYFLEGFLSSQKEIENFIKKCKEFENKNGYITQNIFEIFEDKKYKFLSGPFTNQIFKILEMQKNKISILIGNLETRINKKQFLFHPV